MSSVASRVVVVALVTSSGCSDPPTPTAAAAPAVASAPAASEADPANPVVVAPPPREAVESPSTPEQFVGKHVLVAAGTPLRVAAKPDATALVLEAKDGRLGARAFAVVGHEAGMLKLERAQLEARCDDGLPELDDVAPALFVEPERVVPVLAREAVVRSPDGTSVRLRPGVAIEQSGPNGIVDAGGIRLEVAIDPLDVGTAFTPAMAPPPTEAPHRIHREAQLRYGSKVVDVDVPWFADMRGTLALSKRTDGDDVIVEVLHACATVQARVDPTAVDPGVHASRRTAMHSAMSPGVLGMLSMPQYVVAADVPLVWADGTPAGKLPREQRFDEARHRKAGRTLACFMHAQASDRIAPFELCVKPRQAKREDPYSMLGALGGGAFASELGSGLDSGAFGVLEGPGVADFGGLGDADALGLGMSGRGAGGGGGGAIDLGGLRATATTRVAFSGVSTRGSLTAKTVKSELDSLAPGIRYCAESATPVATGKLSVSLRVGKDGVVRAATASGVAVIEDCVRRTLEGLSLPTASDETEVELTVKVSRDEP